MTGPTTAQRSAGAGGATQPGPRRSRHLHYTKSSCLSAALLLAPSVVMYVKCVLHRQAVWACLTFHVFLCSVMVWEYKCLRRAVAKTSKKSPNALKAFTFILTFGLVSYVFCRAISEPGEYLGVSIPQLRRTLDGYGVSDPAIMIVFALYFAVFNATFEECFWRQCMPTRLRRDFLTFFHHGHHGSHTSTPKSEKRLAWLGADALCSSAYSAYHSVIIATLMPPWFNLGVAFPFLALFGHALAKVRDDPRLGLRTAVALHVGLDLASACWILDLRFGWLDPIFD